MKESKHYQYRSRLTQAIISLADQLLLRPSSYDRNVNIANEDLENHFKVKRSRISLFEMLLHIHATNLS